jgi:hypothetical protein
MTGAGSRDLQRHRAGESLTPSEAIRAKCADCMNNYADGRIDCEIEECPLWPFMPYNPSRRHFRQGKSQAGMIVPGGEDAPGLVAPAPSI